MARYCFFRPLPRPLPTHPLLLQATALALSLQCAHRRRNDLQRIAAARLLRLIQPIAPTFQVHTPRTPHILPLLELLTLALLQRFISCRSHQARARVMISAYLEEDAHMLFLNGKAKVRTATALSSKPFIPLAAFPSPPYRCYSVVLGAELRGRTSLQSAA